MVMIPYKELLFIKGSIMAEKHQEIVEKVRVDWTAKKRGVLFCNNQMNVKYRKRYIYAGLGRGTADLVGIEKPSGTWASIEVKTFGDWLDEKQIKHCKHVLENGGNYYLALEILNGYILEPIYKLSDLDTVKANWRQIWEKS